MYSALKNVAGQMKVYARPSRRPAFLTGLLATVDELKTCAITPEHLWTAGTETGGEEGGKLLDLSLIYGAYEALTARQGADPRDKLTRLDKLLETCPWAHGKDFYVDGFTDFTPQERQVLRRLMTQGESVTVALTCDKLEEDEDGWPMTGESPLSWRSIPNPPGPEPPPWPVWRHPLPPLPPPPGRSRQRKSPSSPPTRPIPR